MDIILLKAKKEPTSEFPSQLPLDMSTKFYHGQFYIQLGFGAYEQFVEPFSVNVGAISATRLDKFGHGRGSSPACPGEPGGPVFDYLTGHLIGMCLGNQQFPDNNGLRSHIVPLNVILIRFRIF